MPYSCCLGSMLKKGEKAVRQRDAGDLCRIGWRDIATTYQEIPRKTCPFLSNTDPYAGHGHGLPHASSNRMARCPQRCPRQPLGHWVPKQTCERVGLLPSVVIALLLSGLPMFLNDLRERMRASSKGLVFHTNRAATFLHDRSMMQMHAVRSERANRDK
jgi:hypothetical protein